MSKNKRTYLHNRIRKKLAGERPRIARFCRTHLRKVGRPESGAREYACVFVQKIFSAYRKKYHCTAVGSVLSFGRMMPEEYERTVRIRKGVSKRAVLGVEFRG